MYWYKYMEKKYAEELVNYGKIRINSLNYYRDIELHGKAVGDEAENTLNAVSVIKGSKTGDQLNELERMFFKSAPGVDSATWAIANATFLFPLQGRPTYGYCLSDALSQELLERMNYENQLVGNPPYDTCVRIKDHVSFVRLLSKHLIDKNLRYYGHGHCSYRTRDIPWEEWRRRGQQCPAFVKDSSYAWQKEVRVLFETRSHDDFEPIDIVIGGLVDLCEIVEVNQP